VDVLSDQSKMDLMMKYSDGLRKVPIIVEEGKVMIGFNGKT